jgi:hypothetical protein
MKWFFDPSKPKRVFWLAIPLLLAAFNLLLWQAIIMARVNHDYWYLPIFLAGIAILACHPAVWMVIKLLRTRSEGGVGHG